MSKAKFTPGPWCPCETQEGLITSVGKDICEIIPTYGDNSDDLSTGFTCEQMSNLDLILAAPDLYAALEQCSKDLNSMIERENKRLKNNIRCDDLDDPDYFDYQAVHEAMIVLAKARGES